MKIKSVKRISLEKPVPVYDIIDSLPTHDFQIRTHSSNIVSHNCAMLDEVDYAKGNIIPADGAHIA